MASESITSFTSSDPEAHQQSGWCAPLLAHLLTFALKILCASLTDTFDDELKVLQHLRTVAPSGHPNVAGLLDSFKISGPKGEHHCLVLPVLGPSLPKTNVCATLSGSTRRQLCQQLASAVAFIHHNGVCHGDLTAADLAFELPKLDSMSPDGVLELLGRIETARLRRLSGRSSRRAPKRVVRGSDFPGLDYSLLRQIRVIDFGEAFFTESPPSSLGTPIEFFPPEVCLGYRPSRKSDIWQLACIFFQRHTKKFCSLRDSIYMSCLVCTIVDCLGPMPQNWLGKYDFDKYGFHQPGKPRRSKDPSLWFEQHHRSKSILKRLEEDAGHLSIQQRKEYELLDAMFVYEPGERLSAENVMQRLASIEFLDSE